MNQILYTGDEDYSNNKNQKVPEYKPTKQKQYKEKKTVPVKKIVVFFAIAILIFGICIIVGSVYGKNKINENVEANSTPLVEMTPADDTVKIAVSHIRGIQQITYQWNDEDEVVINENNQKSLTETIDLPAGKNTLTVTATEENGQTVTYTQEFERGNVPTVDFDNTVDNVVKITCYAEDVIDYITYSWDDGEETTRSIGQQNFVGTITALKGRHTLKVTVVDKNGVPGNKSQTIVGAAEPTVSVKLGKKQGELYFVINVEDEDQLKNIKITLNDEVKVEQEVTDKTYYLELKLEDGVNKLEIEAENSNGITKTEKKSFDTSTISN